MNEQHDWWLDVAQGHVVPVVSSDGLTTGLAVRAWYADGDRQVRIVTDGPDGEVMTHPGMWKQRDGERTIGADPEVIDDAAARAERDEIARQQGRTEVLAYIEAHQVAGEMKVWLVREFVKSHGKAVRP